MGVQKRLVSILILLLIFLSCSTDCPELKELEEAKAEIKSLRKASLNQTQNQGIWLKQMLDISNALNSIDTDSRLLIEMGVTGLERQEKTSHERSLAKIEAIKAQLASQKSQLDSSNKDYQELYQVADQISIELTRKEARLIDIQNEIERIRIVKDSVVEANIRIQDQNQEIIGELDSQSRELITIKKDLSDKDKTINQKHLFLVSRTESKILEINSSQFTLKYRPSKIEILSPHKENSYILAKIGSETTFSITNYDEFWSQSNFLIVRIKQKGFKNSSAIK